MHFSGFNLSPTLRRLLKALLTLYNHVIHVSRDCLVLFEYLRCHASEG
jgi:hypothetical protein